MILMPSSIKMAVRLNDSKKDTMRKDVTFYKISLPEKNSTKKALCALYLVKIDSIPYFAYKESKETGERLSIEKIDLKTTGLTNITISKSSAGTKSTLATYGIQGLLTNELGIFCRCGIDRLITAKQEEVVQSKDVNTWPLLFNHILQTNKSDKLASFLLPSNIRFLSTNQQAFPDTAIVVYFDLIKIESSVVYKVMSLLQNNTEIDDYHSAISILKSLGISVENHNNSGLYLSLEKLVELNKKALARIETAYSLRSFDQPSTLNDHSQSWAPPGAVSSNSYTASTPLPSSHHTNLVTPIANNADDLARAIVLHQLIDQYVVSDQAKKNHVGQQILCFICDPQINMTQLLAALNKDQLNVVTQAFINCAVPYPYQQLLVSLMQRQLEVNQVSLVSSRQSTSSVSQLAGVNDTVQRGIPTASSPSFFRHTTDNTNQQPPPNNNMMMP